MNSTIKLGAVLLLILGQIISCQKKPVTQPEKEKVCQIKRATYQLFGTPQAPSEGIGPSTALFNYNSFGNPVSVVISNPIKSNPHLLFMYDQYNRLTDYIGTIGSNTDPSKLPNEFPFVFWYKYNYRDQNPSSMPTDYAVQGNGTYKNGILSSIATTYGNLLYDSQGRLTTGGRRYDSDGNRIFYSTVEIYDNKTSFRRTNKIWMFIDDDYSVNNAFTALEYNAAGLPTKFPPAAPPRVYSIDFLSRQMDLFTIEYSCSISNKID